MDTQKVMQANDLFTEGRLTHEDLQAVVGGGLMDGLDNVLAVTQFGLPNAINPLSDTVGTSGDAVVNGATNTTRFVGGFSQELVGATRRFFVL